MKQYQLQCSSSLTDRVRCTKNRARTSRRLLTVVLRFIQNSTAAYTHSSQSVITRGGSEGRQSVNDTTHSSQSITMTLGSSQLIHYTAAVEHTHNIHGREGWVYHTAWQHPSTESAAAAAAKPDKQPVTLHSVHKHTQQWYYVSCRRQCRPTENNSHFLHPLYRITC